MIRPLTRTGEWTEARLLDEETWDLPRQLTDLDLFAQGSAGWRRSDCALDDPEDER